MDYEFLKDLSNEELAELKVAIDVEKSRIGRYSEYARVLEDCNLPMTVYTPSLMYFVGNVHLRAMDILFSKGILTLNDVYDLLRQDKTQSGQLVGWTMSTFEKCNTILDFIPLDEHSCIVDFHPSTTNVWETFEKESNNI